MSDETTSDADHGNTLVTSTKRELRDSLPIDAAVERLMDSDRDDGPSVGPAARAIELLLESEIE